MGTSKIASTFLLRAAGATKEMYFDYPKDKKYSGYAYLVIKDSKPDQGLGLKKTVKPGVYLRKDFIKVAGIPTMSELTDRIGTTFSNLAEIAVGTLVKIKSDGKAEFHDHMGRKVVLPKDYVDFLIKSKYFVTEEELDEA